MIDPGLIVPVIGVAILITAVAYGLYRLIAGPTTPDRVVAADTLSIIATAALAWLALAFDNPIYLDIALVYGALAFVGVVAVARAIERRGA